MGSKARQDVRNFLRTTKGRPHGGAPCIMCSHPKRKEIEEASEAFNEQRKLWSEGATQENPDTGDEELLGTNLPWDVFVRDYLKTKLGYTGRDKRPLIRHLEHHVGLTIH